MPKIITPPFEEAKRLFEGKMHTNEVEVGISFINYGFATRRDGTVRIMEPGPIVRPKCYWKRIP
jgi:hypothetical protein